MELKYSTVRERDMDLMLLEAIGSDKHFAKLIVERTKWGGSDFEIKTIELSRTDPELGESDMTLVIQVDNFIYGILIEDKIDAIAMPDQHKRYEERGKRGIKSNEYNDFDIIIICPEKYFNNNEEAKLYEHHIFYEELEKYFKSQKDDVSKIRLMQVKAAINKAKKPTNVVFNKDANSFLINYSNFQKQKYPNLDLRTRKTSNGWWTKYGVRFGKAYIYHKMQEGFVDLTFPNAADHLDKLYSIAKNLRKLGVADIIAVQTGKAGALRIEVPPLKVQEPFEATPKSDLTKCFEAISRLSNLTEMFLNADIIKEL